MLVVLVWRNLGTGVHEQREHWFPVAATGNSSNSLARQKRLILPIPVINPSRQSHHLLQLPRRRPKLGLAVCISRHHDQLPFGAAAYWPASGLVTEVRQPHFGTLVYWLDSSTAKLSEIRNHRLLVGPKV